MSTQQDIYAAGSETRPPMLNKENYVPWSSRLLRYAKSRPNGKLIYNSIMNGPYRNTTLGCYFIAVDSCETAQEIWLRVQQMMKGSNIRIQEKKAKLFNECERFTSTDGESIESYYHRFSKLMNDFKRNKLFPEKIANNLKFLNNLQPEWSRHVTIVHQTKDSHIADYTQLYDFLKYNQKEVDDLRAERLVKTHNPLALMANSNNPYSYPMFHPNQPSPSTYMQQPLPNNNNYNPQPSQMQMVKGNGGNQFRKYARKIVGNQNRYNAVQNNPNANGNVVAARAEGNVNGNNEAGIQLQAKEFDLMAGVGDLDEIEEVNGNCILMANLQNSRTTPATVEETRAYFES
ncbi:hypothetical protein Tco_0886602 [Tanacetum coccineum]